MASIANRNVADQHTTENREGLSSWWSRFKARPAKKEPEIARSIFSVPLHESITYANVAISLYNDDGQTFIYGYIPIVVAKCGLFLKDNATETEGIFRLSGSAKRIKDLQAIFDQPPKYGKGLDWTGFTVHDAANILRRYLNHLPDPIIPYDWYDSFREPLKKAWPLPSTIARMQELVASLPPLNRQLLLYILDLLAVFASKSEINRMTSENLSAIFQPGLITHPRDDMSPQEYKLSQEVLVFLIDNQAHFLLDSLCAPTQEQPVTPQTSAKRTSLLRRRTLQPSRRSSAANLPVVGGQEHTLEGNSDLNPLSQATKQSSVSSLSRSNTVPSKRNPPISLNRQQAHLQPRHVSSPTIGNTHKHSSLLQSAPLREASTTHGDEAPSSEQPRNMDDSPSRSDLAGCSSSAHILPGASRNTPVTNSLSLPSRSASHSSLRDSSKHSSSSRLDLEALKAAAIPIPGTQDNSHVVSAEPAGTATTASATRSMDKSAKVREGQQSSPSPSKFSNLFKKKTKSSSVPVEAAATTRRDLDR